jgi:hypothetical protein
MAGLDREKSWHITVLCFPVQECKKPHACIVIQVFKASYVYKDKAALVYLPVCTPRMICHGFKDG